MGSIVIAFMVNGGMAGFVFWMSAKSYITLVVQRETKSGRNMVASLGPGAPHDSITASYFASYWLFCMATSTVLCWIACGGGALAPPAFISFIVTYTQFSSFLDMLIKREFEQKTNSAHVLNITNMELGKSGKGM